MKIGTRIRLKKGWMCNTREKMITFPKGVEFIVLGVDCLLDIKPDFIREAYKLTFRLDSNENTISDLFEVIDYGKAKAIEKLDSMINNTHVYGTGIEFRKSLIEIKNILERD